MRDPAHPGSAAVPGDRRVGPIHTRGASSSSPARHATACRWRAKGTWFERYNNGSRVPDANNIKSMSKASSRFSPDHVDGLRHRQSDTPAERVA